MDIKHFLDKVCNEIKYKPVRSGISEELKLHIQEIKEDYQNQGMEEKKAEEKAVSQMGEAEEIGTLEHLMLKEFGNVVRQ